MSQPADPALPAVVLAYVLPLLFRSRQPAYLRCDDSGELQQAGGALAHYGLAELRPGPSVVAQVGLLLGLLPHHGPPLVLSAVHTDGGRIADLHIFVDGGDTWVVLIDSTGEHDQKQAMQQKGNELSLRSEKQALVLDSYLGKSVATQILAGRWQRSGGGERREVTLLFADIREFTPFSEGSTPESVFSTLNQYLPAMIEPIEARGGLIEQITGDAIMAVFGLSDEGTPAAVQAVAAGLAVQRAAAEVTAQRTSAGQIGLGIGVGIATGPAAIGIVGTQARRGFAAIGHHVNLASRLQGLARASEVVLDEHTHALWQAALASGQPLDRPAPLFSPRPATLKGLRDSLQVYVTAVV